MTPLKDLYSPAFYNAFAEVVVRILPMFDQQQFLAMIFNDTFSQKELKDRMRHTAHVLHHFLPADFEEATDLLQQLINQLKQDKIGENSFPFMFLPEYIEAYGLAHYTTSVKAIEQVTQFISCEFAVRPFLLNYGDQMMDQLLKWSHHDNAHVRRLASEGSRSRLPWAMAVPALKKDPTATLAILENLKNDPSEWVRRSVANNLNDISKDHPAIALQVARTWKGISRETDAVIKHGCRTLLKQGHPDVLALYQLDSTSVQLDDFAVLTPLVRIGDQLSFSFSLRNAAAKPQLVRLEYAIYFVRLNGKLSKKVFKISERSYAPNEQFRGSRQQKFVPITTRRHYPGTHRISLIVNGLEKVTADFELVPQ